MLVYVSSYLQMAGAATMTHRARLIGSTVSVIAALTLVEAAAAQDARWKANPPGNNWNNPVDWDPETVPTGTASFGPSSRTGIVFSERNVAIGRIRFEAGAPAYTFVLDGNQRLRVTGFGIENLSGNAQTFVIARAPPFNLPPDEPFFPTMRFEGSSSAGNAVFTTGSPSVYIGELAFQDSSSAATATIHNGATLSFKGSSSAATSHIFNSVTAYMFDDATGDRATIDNRFGAFFFRDRATAAQSTIHNINGSTTFLNASTAGSSHIVNDPGPRSDPPGIGIGTDTTLGILYTNQRQQTGFTVFDHTSRAGTATIINNAGAAPYVPSEPPLGLNLANSGATVFAGDSSAENAAITNNGGGAGSFLRITGPRNIPGRQPFIEANNAALTFFADRATAANATIVNNNAAWTAFFDQSSAGAATITTNSGSTVLFRDQSSGGTARFINNAGGTVDISGLTSVGAQVGSIEGAGAVGLGGRRLTLGGNNRSTEISGIISDGGFSGGTGGSLVKTGTGTLTLSGASTYTGATTVATGGLIANGSLASAVTVDQGARLGGIGRVGGAAVSGTLAPGNGIGTINVSGNATFAAGSTYEVEVDGAGNGDRTLVTGTAAIQGGTVAALFQGQAEQCGAPFKYTILTAQGGVSGAFAAVTSNFAFLAPSLSYDPNNVFLTLTRSPATFADHGVTPNQQQAAAAAEALGCGNAVFDAVVGLSSAAAGAAFDQLSGEIHASLRGALLDDSRFVREAMLGQREARRRVWAHGYASWGEIESDGNAAALDRESSGLFAGADLPIGSGWSAGIGGGYSRARFRADARGSRADLDTWHLAGRVAGHFGGLRLAAGGAVSWHEIDTERHVAFPGFSDDLSASYHGRTSQAFAEAGYELPIGRGTIVEPFVQGAWVKVRTDGFTEAGGAAAMGGAEESDGAGFTTLGLRARKGFGTVALTGSAGWRHAFGLDPSEARLAFAGAAAPFTVAGTPIATDALMLDAGVEIGIGGSGRLNLSYSGQLAGRSEDHGARAVLSLPF